MKSPIAVIAIPDDAKRYATIEKQKLTSPACTCTIFLPTFRASQVVIFSNRPGRRSGGLDNNPAKPKIKRTNGTRDNPTTPLVCAQCTLLRNQQYCSLSG